MFKHRDLEQQLMDAKLAQSDMQVSEEKKRSIAEKELVSGALWGSTCGASLDGVGRRRFRSFR